MEGRKARKEREESCPSTLQKKKKKKVASELLTKATGTWERQVFYGLRPHKDTKRVNAT